MSGPTPEGAPEPDPGGPATGTAEVLELARLARLRPADPAGIAAQLDRLLGHFAVLREVDTDGVEAAAYPLEIPHRTRDDAPEPPLPREQVLANAPAQRAGCFLVPRVLEG